MHSPALRSSALITSMCSGTGLASSDIALRLLALATLHASQHSGMEHVTCSLNLGTRHGKKVWDWHISWLVETLHSFHWDVCQWIMIKLKELLWFSQIGILRIMDWHEATTNTLGGQSFLPRFWITWFPKCEWQSRFGVNLWDNLHGISRFWIKVFEIQMHKVGIASKLSLVGIELVASTTVLRRDCPHHNHRRVVSWHKKFMRLAPINDNFPAQHAKTFNLSLPIGHGNGTKVVFDNVTMKVVKKPRTGNGTSSVKQNQKGCAPIMHFALLTLLTCSQNVGFMKWRRGTGAQADLHKWKVSKFFVWLGGLNKQRSNPWRIQQWLPLMQLLHGKGTLKPWNVPIDQHIQIGGALTKEGAVD